MLPTTILVVDDEEIVRKLVRVALNGPGSTNILEARDSTEALQVSEGHSGRIDLLLTDVTMPGAMDGTERAVKLSHELPETKVLLMSGYDVQAVSMEADWQFIQKPFAASEIRAAIRNVLANVPIQSVDRV
jgi:two-component system, cell cycle sensor histidine kinase and response regulator CckA